MPKILFIQPTQYDGEHKLCKQKRIFLPGLQFPLLAAMTPKEWEVEVLIEVIHEIDFNSDADIIGIGSMGHAAFRGVEIADEFRRRGKTVVMGGYMASMAVEEVSKHVDSVIIGDAEISYPMMLNDFVSTGKLKPVYDYPITSLDGLPVPRYEILTAMPIGNMLPVQAGRGCPNTCSYCSISCLYKGKYIARPVDEIIRDIKRVKELGYNAFYLLDDNIVGNPRLFLELCAAIKPLKMKWSSQCSMLLADKPELLKAAVDSGVEMLSFGIETISQEGLNALGKGWLKVSEHEKRIDILSKAGIVVNSEMIVGTDSDTVESIRATYDFIMRTRIPLARFYILTPIPGTGLWKKYKDEGRLITEDINKFTTMNAVHIPLHMTPQEVDQSFWELYKRLYTIKSIVLRTLFHPHFFKKPATYVFAFFVNMHYRGYVKRGVPPNIF